ncbi:MAG: endolytic transglycosylase MltG [Patescibacteria group bacterium]
MLISLVGLTFGWYFFGAVGTSAGDEIFSVPQDSSGFKPSESLKEKGLIRNAVAFQFLLDTFAKEVKIQSGGYRLNQGMTAWGVLAKIIGRPDLMWITISGCPRREQIGEKLAGIFGWESGKEAEWNTLAASGNPDYFEGVYYPDTYLLPVDGSVAEIAKRLTDRFNEKFSPLAPQFIAANIKWTTGLKIASLIAREAGGAADMRLISGVIWNRLNIGMPLQIDATMQYTLGKRADGSWWGSVDLAEKQNDSPYNSYLYKGLPPTPICSPNITMIEAALKPEETACLFYLHDRLGKIHCAETYAEHLANIRRYLN